MSALSEYKITTGLIHPTNKPAINRIVWDLFDILERTGIVKFVPNFIIKNIITALVGYRLFPIVEDDSKI